MECTYEPRCVAVLRSSINFYYFLVLIVAVQHTHKPSILSENEVLLLPLLGHNVLFTLARAPLRPACDQLIDERAHISLVLSLALTIYDVRHVAH